MREGDVFRVACNHASRSYDVYWYQGNRYVNSVTISTAELNQGEYVEPSLRLRCDEAQQLMDELWESGLRPNSGEGTQAATSALQAHLDDMRALVFKIEPRKNK